MRFWRWFMEPVPTARGYFYMFWVLVILAIANFLLEIA